MEKSHIKRLVHKGKNIHIMHWIRFQWKEKWIFIHFLYYSYFIRESFKKRRWRECYKSHITELLHYQAASPKGKFLLNLVVLFCKILQVFLLW